MTGERVIVLVAIPGFRQVLHTGTDLICSVIPWASPSWALPHYLRPSISVHLWEAS